MKSLKAAGKELLELSDLLVSTGQEQASSDAWHQKRSKIVGEYDTATGNLSLQLDSRLKDATKHLSAETLRLSVTSPKHPHFHQIRSNQRFAKELFAKEIERLVERN